jgi:hypothetical protein
MPLARKKDGKLGRNVSPLSFHSVRHSFNSAMANADVPLEIRQKLTGHASPDMNKHYTHLELQTVGRPHRPEDPPAWIVPVFTPEEPEPHPGGANRNNARSYFLRQSSEPDRKGFPQDFVAYRGIVGTVLR